MRAAKALLPYRSCALLLVVYYTIYQNRSFSIRYNHQRYHAQTDFRRLLQRAACLQFQPQQRLTNQTIRERALAFAERRYDDFAHLSNNNHLLGAKFLHYSSRLGLRIALARSGKFDLFSIYKTQAAVVSFFSDKLAVRPTKAYGNAVFATYYISKREVVVIDAPAAIWQVKQIDKGHYVPVNTNGRGWAYQARRPYDLLYGCDYGTRRFLSLYVHSGTQWADLLRRYALLVQLSCGSAGYNNRNNAVVYTALALRQASLASLEVDMVAYTAGYCGDGGQSGRPACYNMLDYRDYPIYANYTSLFTKTDQYMQTSQPGHYGYDNGLSRPPRPYEAFYQLPEQPQRPYRLQQAQEPYYTYRALALFPAFALFNHACDANVLYFQAGKSLILVAARQIEPGEQLFVSYFPGFEYDLNERIERAAHFGFTCTCALCKQYYYSYWQQSERLHADASLQGFLCAAENAKRCQIHYFPLLLRTASLEVRERFLSGALRQNDASLQAVICQDLDFDLQSALRDDFDGFGNANQYNLDLYPHVAKMLRLYKLYPDLGAQVRAYYYRLGYWLFGIREKVNASLKETADS